MAAPHKAIWLATSQAGLASGEGMAGGGTAIMQTRQRKELGAAASRDRNAAGSSWPGECLVTNSGNKFGVTNSA
jgi:hypothetical protein